MSYSNSPVKHARALVCGLIALMVSVEAGAAEIITSQKDQQEVSLTVYNEDLALIRDVRTVPLTKGLNSIAVREVSARIRPETAILTNVSHPDSLSLLEQNFDYDLLTPEQLLQKYVGRQVTIVKTHPTTGAEKEVTATVLSANDGVVLRIGDRIETGVPGRIVYDQVPDTLRERPTLSVLVHSAVGDTHTLALSYLSGGLGWRADYVAELDQDDAYLDMSGWVTLNNQSGTSYTDATLQLVAGDVHTVRESFRHGRREDGVGVMRERRAAPMREEELFEYHLYTLEHQTDVLNNQTKQVALMSASRVPVNKEFLLRGQARYYRERHRGVIGDKIPVGVYMEFANVEKNDLGIALPRGVVRVYTHDSTGAAQFIGEDRIAHTPKDETIRLKLGDAFDVTAKRTQTEYEEEKNNRLRAGDEYVTRSGFEIEIHNAKEEAVVVRVLEPVPGDWEMVSSSLPHTQPDAHTAEWNVRVPAERRVTLTYTVQMRRWWR